MTKGYEFHEIANCWTLIEGVEFKALVQDIKANDVIEPIWLYQGKILDGRNRYLASQKAKVECPSREYTGDDPAGFALSLNDRRRHQSPSQKALVGARLATLAQGARRDLAKPANLRKVSQSEAASLLKVSTRAIQSANQILKSAKTEIIEGIEKGDITINAAMQLLKLTEQEEKRIQAVQQPKKQPALLNNEFTESWFTPMPVIEAVTKFYEGVIDTDPASTTEANARLKARVFFDKKTNGLSKQWTGKVYMNPPYSTNLLNRFVDTLIEKGTRQEFDEAIVLLPNACERPAIQKMLAHSSAVLFFNQRLRFHHHSKGTGTTPMTGSILFYMGHRPHNFKFHFQCFGVIL